MKIILASKIAGPGDYTAKNNIQCKIEPSNVDEDQVKDSFNDGADPVLVSKNLAELKSIKVSKNYPDQIVLGADSVISLNNELINKPKTREEALAALKKLNGSINRLITSVCISKNGAMIWNCTDQSELKMKKLSNKELAEYLKKINTETLLSYGVYQIEAGGLELFEHIKGDISSIMGLPIKQIIDYIKLTT